MASYEHRSAGWSVRFRMISETGEERQLRLSGFPTKKEAREAYEKYVAEHKACESRAGRPRTLAELADGYFIYLRPNVKESSFYETRRRIEGHILNVFGDRKVEDITALDLVAWQADIAARYSRPYLVTLRAAFTALWNYGTAFCDIRSNPWPRVKLPKDNSAPREMAVWTPEQFAAFLAFVEDPVYRLLFRTLFLTGCRKGEALALGPADVSSNLISISKSITRKAGEPWKVTTPKTRGSIRRVTVPVDLAEDLSRLPGPFLFGGEAPFADRTVERVFHEATEAAGVPRIRLHDLRHSHASFLISSGCSIVAVSKRLGHCSVKQTLDTYSHALASDEFEVISKVAEMDATPELVTKLVTKNGEMEVKKMNKGELLAKKA